MPILTLDHLVIVAPSIPEGVEHVRTCLDLDVPEGGRHREMGTRNHLLRLGDAIFLEVIAVDPDAAAPGPPRWFGLSDQVQVRKDWDDGRRLRGFVVRTNNLDGTLSAHPHLFGTAATMTRGALSWRFGLRADGAWPEDGDLPCVMDWGARGNPAAAMPDLGARLTDFALAHPEPEPLRERHAALGIEGVSRIVPGAKPRFTASIATPSGLRGLS